MILHIFTHDLGVLIEINIFIHSFISLLFLKDPTEGALHEGWGTFMKNKSCVLVRHVRIFEQIVEYLNSL